MQLLLVEDDSHLAQAISAALASRYKVTHACSVREAQDVLEQHANALYIIDIGLPDGSGLDLIPRIRQHDGTAAVLMLTAEHQLAIKVHALDAGADDYLTKPFSMRELEARLRALSRRAHVHDEMRCGKLVLHRSKRTVTYESKLVLLRNREFLLLEDFMLHTGRVRAHTQLAELIWENNDQPQSNALVVYITRLRLALSKVTATQLIHTVPGVGYVLDPGRKA